MMNIIVSFTCFTAQKMNFPIKDFFKKCDQIIRKLKEKILNGKLHFLYSERRWSICFQILTS